MSAPAAPGDPPVAPDLMTFVRWLSADARAVEIWALAGAQVATVRGVTRDGAQSLDLDSGDWVLVRLSGAAAPQSFAAGFLRFRRSAEHAAAGGSDGAGGGEER